MNLRKLCGLSVEGYIDLEPCDTAWMNVYFVCAGHLRSSIWAAVREATVAPPVEAAAEPDLRRYSRELR